MGGNIAEVAVAGLLFVGSHFLLSGSSFRAPIAAKLGETKFLILYSFVALFSFIWLVTAYSGAPVQPIWNDTGWGRSVLLVLMLPACLLLVCGYMAPSPTVVGMAESALPADTPATGIRAITRHPVLWAIVLWAAGHLWVNGDVASVLFFGSLLILALGGMVHIDSRRREAGLAHWPNFEETTSILPFGAILEGRNDWTNARVPWLHLVIGAVLYAVFLALHGAVVGRSPFP